MLSDQHQVSTTTASSTSPNSNNHSSSPPSSSSTNNNNNNNSSSDSQQSEKPTHYTYLKEFRVEQCPNFIQHKCTQHKPYTCFRWHFQNQRRRRPVRRRDGTFNYSPDVYCTKYDETTGLCEDGDDCPYLHRTSGDTERRYHLRYYKTGICVYETDPRGFCVKNGQHCAFAHGCNDLRNPVYDVRELQVMEGDGAAGEGNLNGPNQLDKDRNALNEDPRWTESAYVLCNYKTELCKRPPRLCRQGYACPQYHNSKDKRRSPKKFKYRSTPCPNVKQGDEWGDPCNCDSGDACPYCHTRTEQQFHPEIYKSTKCNDILQTQYCPRGPFCAFAHKEHEMQSRHDLLNEDVELKNYISNGPPLTRAQSCSSGSRTQTVASSLPDHYPGMNGLLQHQNQTAFSKAGGDSILGNPNSNHGASLLGSGVQQQPTSAVGASLGAIGTRPRSYSTSASVTHAGHNMDRILGRMNALRNANQLESPSSQLDQYPHHTQDDQQRTNSSSGHRRSSGVFDSNSASSPLFPGRFGSGDTLGPITASTSSSSSSSRTVQNLENYSTAETVGSVIESAIGEHEVHFDEMEGLGDFHHLTLNRNNTQSLFNGNDVLLDHYHPNQQQPLHHSVHGVTNSSRTDPVNIPGARMGVSASNDRALNLNNSASSPPINASPMTRSSFDHLSHQFGLSPFPRSRVDTGTMSTGVVHNNSQASSVVDSFLPGLSTSPQQTQQNLVQAASSILENQRLERDLKNYANKFAEIDRHFHKTLLETKLQLEDQIRRTKEIERQRDEAITQLQIARQELENEARTRNHNLIGSSCLKYHSLPQTDLCSYSLDQLSILKEQLKNDLDNIDKVLCLKSSLSSSSCPTSTPA